MHRLCGGFPAGSTGIAESGVRRPGASIDNTRAHTIHRFRAAAGTDAAAAPSTVDA
jgi:hypothetical protein